MLKVNQLSKSFGARQAVAAVSFGLRRSQTLGLIGPNGAGKSTTVALLGFALLFGRQNTA